MIDCCEIGSTPPFWAETATPFRVWTWSTQIASSRAAWIALWIVNPAGLMSWGLSSTLFPARSILTRLEAVISSKRHSVGVDQEVVVRAGHARGDVGEDEVAPSVHRDQPVAGGEVDALPPLGVADVGLDGRVWHRGAPV
jgi:hypothetical protein